jgi:hypothetical protein
MDRCPLARLKKKGYYSADELWRPEQQSFGHVEQGSRVAEGSSDEHIPDMVCCEEGE